MARISKSNISKNTKDKEVRSFALIRKKCSYDNKTPFSVMDLKIKFCKFLNKFFLYAWYELQDLVRTKKAIFFIPFYSLWNTDSIFFYGLIYFPVDILDSVSLEIQNDFVKTEKSHIILYDIFRDFSVFYVDNRRIS